jgi:hypothetical protein
MLVSHSGVDADLSLLGCDVVSSGEQSPIDKSVISQTTLVFVVTTTVPTFIFT